MMLTLSWQQIMWVTGIFLTCFIAWNGFLVAIIKWLVAREISGFDKRIDAIAASICTPAKCDELKRIGQELVQTRVELPVLYTRRDDSIRENTVNQARIEQLVAEQQQSVKRDDLIRDMTVIHAKFDALSERVQRVLEGRTGSEIR